MALVNGDQTESHLDVPVNLHRVCEECREQNLGNPEWCCPFGYVEQDCDEFGHVGYS